MCLADAATAEIDATNNAMIEKVDVIRSWAIGVDGLAELHILRLGG